jgi:hypothetical protein
LFDTVEPNPALLLYDGNGVLRTFNGIQHAFQPSTGLVVWDGQGEVRSATGFNASEASSGSWAFGSTGFESPGISTAGFGVDYSDHFAGFITNDENGKNRIFLATPPSSNNWVTLNLNDANQQTRSQLITYDNGAGSWAEAAYLQDQNGVFRSGLQVDNPCCGNGLGSDSLFFFNPTSELTGFFYSGPTTAGAGTYVTEDGAGSETGHLP